MAVYTKIKPLSVETTFGIPRFDDEGRSLKLTFKDFILYNFYIPHGGRTKENIPYKFDVYAKLLDKVKQESHKEIILAGDFNIAHKEIDVFYAKQNVGNTMFTPEERALLDTLLSHGYVDTFRQKYPDKKGYTWWPYMNDLRKKDMAGWRIDYIFVSRLLENKILDTFMAREVLGSDHGPYTVILDKKVHIEPIVRSKIVEEPTLF